MNTADQQSPTVTPPYFTTSQDKPVAGAENWSIFGSFMFAGRLFITLLIFTMLKETEFVRW